MTSSSQSSCESTCETDSAFPAARRGKATECKRSALSSGLERETQSAASANSPQHPLHRPVIVACEDDNYDDLDRPRQGGIRPVVEQHIDETSAADLGAGCARRVQRQMPVQQVGQFQQTSVDADTVGPDTGRARGESVAGKSNATAQHYSQRYHHPYYFYPQYPSPHFRSASFPPTLCDPGEQNGNQTGQQMFLLPYYPYPLAHAPHIVGQTEAEYGMTAHHPGINAYQARHKESLSYASCRVDRKEQAAHINRRDGRSAASPDGNWGRSFQETDWNTGRIWREDDHQSTTPSVTASPISAESPASPRRSIVQRMESSLRSSFGLKNSRLDSIGESEITPLYSSEYLSPNEARKLELLSNNLKAKYPGNPRARHKTSRLKTPAAPIHKEQYYCKTGHDLRQGGKSVRFGTVQIRTYETILGDNPSCSKGPGMSIGWRYDPTHVNATVDSYERHQMELFGAHKSRPEELVLHRYEREAILLGAGYTSQDLAQSVRITNKIKSQRRQTIHNLKAAWLEEKVEAAKKVVGKRLKRRKSANHLYECWKCK